MAPLTASDLIFSPQANHNFSTTLSSLKRSTLSIQNRLSSILKDASFVQQVFDAYSRPLVANERCGSWYIDPSQHAGSAYFKSTDGHTGVWSFSTRRLNLHLLELIGTNDGIIVVDSTRRGKRMPDALSKTIPIWCSVLNRVLFPNDPRAHDLYTPPQVVSASEHAQIASRLDTFVQSFENLDIDLANIRKQIKKPIRPIWITPESPLSPTSHVFSDFHPIICCTSSRRVSGTEVSEGGYIQGSGDDTENWAQGLTSQVFWAHKELLLSTPEEELPDTIARLLVASTNSDKTTNAKLESIAPTTSMFVVPESSLTSIPAEKNSLIITLPSSPMTETGEEASNNSFTFPIGTHKLASRNLRIALPQITSFLSKKLSSGNNKQDTNIIIACSTGKDISVGVALAILCLFYDDFGALLEPGEMEKGNENRKPSAIDKTFIRKRLGWIMTSMPGANPSRATLQSVNSFLMQRPD